MLLTSKDVWMDYLSKAIQEMKEKQTVLLTRGDLIKEEQIPLYKNSYKELIEAKWFLKQTGDVKATYRYLTMNVFMKNESFFMDLFETNEFPRLFDLFELE